MVILALVCTGEIKLLLGVKKKIILVFWPKSKIRSQLVLSLSRNIQPEKVKSVTPEKVLLEITRCCPPLDEDARLVELLRSLPSPIFEDVRFVVELSVKLLLFAVPSKTELLKWYTPKKSFVQVLAEEGLIETLEFS